MEGAVQPRVDAPSAKEAGPWAWFDEVAVRVDVAQNHVIAEVTKPLNIEWSGWVLLYGAKRILRGDSAEDVMGRIDAILESDGWTLRPIKKPLTADRVVTALMKEPKLAEAVRDLLNKHFA